MKIEHLFACVALALLPGCGVLVDVDRETIEEGERGVLGGYQGGTIFGWAIGDDDAPVVVQLTYGREVTAVTADQPRPDLQEREGIPFGAAGFEVEVGDLPPGTAIRALILPSGLELANSPYVVGEPTSM